MRYAREGGSGLLGEIVRGTIVLRNAEPVDRKTDSTHGVGASELLLGPNDGAGALGGVEGGLALDDGLALAAAEAAAAGLAADFRHGFPVLVGHCVCFGVGLEVQVAV